MLCHDERIGAAMTLEEAWKIAVTASDMYDERSYYSAEELAESRAATAVSGALLLPELVRLRERVTENDSLLALLCEFNYSNQDYMYTAEVYPGITGVGGSRLEAAAAAHTRAHQELDRLRAMVERQDVNG